MKAREAVFQWLQERGMNTIFGNPGSTEIPFLVGLPPAIRYILGLQESIVVAMADGFAQASGHPALANLHAAPGLGNAIGALFTARKNKSPLIVTVGQQDTRHIIWEPLLAADLAAMAQPVVKWSYEVARAEDVPEALEQAYHLAASPPMGPVFLSIPANFWDAPASPVVPRRLQMPGPPQGLDEVANALTSGTNPALVIGAGVERAGARPLAIQLAEKLNCDVFGDPLGSRVGFPTDHPLFRGMLLPAAPRITQALNGHDVIVVIGAPLFLVYPYLPGPLLPPGARAYLITDDPAEAVRAPAACSFVGDIVAALRELSGSVLRQERSAPARATDIARRRMEAARARAQMGVAYVLQALDQRLPAEAVVLDEAISASPALREHVPVDSSGGYFTAASGGLGWAVPAAVGVKLAWPDRSVVAVIGDGSLLYAVQALWTAAREELALTVIVLNNAGYAILKSYTNAFYPGQADLPGLDLPGIDLVSLAQGLGAKAERVATADELDAALERALSATGPYLLDVQVDRKVPNLF